MTEKLIRKLYKQAAQARRGQRQLKATDQMSSEDLVHLTTLVKFYQQRLAYLRGDES